MKKYLFVDFIRFWGMFSIVYIHSIQASDAAFHLKTNLLEHGNIYDFLQLPLKYGSICFYVISGFLLGDKLLDSSPVSFLKKRLNNTMTPYFAAFILFVVWNSLRYIFGAEATHGGVGEYFVNLATDFKTTLLYSPYWFIWNFFIALSIVILFRKYIFTKIFPVILLLITLIYSVNIYYEWFPPQHTTAVFGFVFYLWAGVFLHKNHDALNNFIKKTPLMLLLLVTLIFLFCDYYETSVLYARNSVDPHNTLKISTQLFSITMFFVLMKITHIGVPRFFNPRKETFGIYLYHMFFIVLFARLVHYTPLNKFAETKGILVPLLLFLAYFLFTYLGVSLLVKALNKTPLSWMVGNNDKAKSELLARELNQAIVQS